MVTTFSVGGSACWGKELTVTEAVESGFGGTQGWASLHGAPRNPLWHKPWKELVSRVSWVFQPKQNVPKMLSNGKWSTESRDALMVGKLFGCCKSRGSWACRLLILPVTFHKSLLVNTPFPKVIYLPVCCWGLLDPNSPHSSHLPCKPAVL